jgi:hypothetical protein
MQPRGSTPLRLGLAAAATYFIAHFLGWDALALLMKPAPVLCLLAFLLPVRNRDAALVAGGLLLSAVGDLLLEASPALFLPGLVAFLLAHVMYIIAFVGRTSRPGRRWGSGRRGSCRGRTTRGRPRWRRAPRTCRPRRG